MQVVVHERQRVRQRIHFASDETGDKLLHGLVEGGSTKNGVDQVLNFVVEVVQGGVESGSGGVDPTEDAIVDGALDGIHLRVDLGDVDGGLVQHVLVHDGGDGVGEICRGREGLVAIRVCDGTESQELNLNGKETDEADEETGHGGWVENVAKEPLEVNVLRVRKAQKTRDLIGDPHEKGMSSDSVESEKVVVRELHGGSRTGGGIMMDGGIGVPGLADVLEVVLKAAPLVPFESAVGKDEEDHDSDDDDGGNLRDLDDIATEIVDDRGVNLVAERDGGLLRNGQNGLLEGDIVEGAGDLLLCQFEGSVEAGEWMNEKDGIAWRRLEAYRALSLSLIWSGEGIELLSLINA